ncbi:hypothetical protein SARC_07449 [Sphaeroforma arctica JP610]|uniref:riboflavin kinase n=1 Tax=Sphaeroforma arctica JP610 TaxID=667725 RepID=A0A0L0FW65_9EUKA|nr:hypothetical protein SARC_07449 [Sphaeroforma arctica JP610]KNC80188.1 hypothetical protein SARC_07449 [Sphaeroforma arctica JP610]|eukprot:XP_014154090.1 hypothetical protein SARC_07449 [Sphaeroforma arctica JP610]
MAEASSENFVFPSEPLLLAGEVTKGFGRGSKDLGCPTANLPQSEVDKIQNSYPTGVYWGWATLDDKEPVYPMVMSIGYNPFYDNKTKTAEVHILHDFDGDFYGEMLRIAILGFWRGMKNYEGVDALIADIENDKKVAREELAKPENTSRKHLALP